MIVSTTGWWSRSAAVAGLLVIAAVLLVACDDGRRVTSVRASEPDADGVRSYRVEASDGSVVSGSEFVHTGHPSDDWVRHCFDAATHGGGVPFYCLAGHTPGQMAIGGLLAIASISVVWLLTVVVRRRMPAPAPVEPVSPDDWLFVRAEAEKQAYRPVWWELWRMSITGYVGRAGVASLGTSMAVALAIGLIGPGWLRAWFVAAGLANLLAFIAFYAWRSFTSDHLDEVTHARLTSALGIAFGLLIAGLLLNPPGLGGQPMDLAPAGG